jgi:hypothetical protein
MHCSDAVFEGLSTCTASIASCFSYIAGNSGVYRTGPTWAKVNVALEIVSIPCDWANTHKNVHQIRNIRRSYILFALGLLLSSMNSILNRPLDFQVSSFGASECPTIMSKKAALGWCAGPP